MPKSAACLIALITSLPPSARPMMPALEPCACSRYELKSGVLSGERTAPSTLPPFLSMTAEASPCKA
ncbi:hypothetical protein D3C72_2218690 [compost metagenome]